MKKRYLEKEEQHQVEINILNDKLEEKDKLLRFQDSTKILDDILSKQRSIAIKIGLGFHEFVEGGSSSQSKTRNSNEKSKMLNNEMRCQSHQQPRKEILQRKSFTPNYGSETQLFPQMNNVQCYVCHNFGHVVARCRSRMVQDHHTEISSRSRYFKGYCFSCNMFGHKAFDFYRRNTKHIRCYECNMLGHIAKECRNKVRAPYQKEKTSSQLNIWKKKEVQSERCGTTQCIDMTDSEGAESVKLHCSKSHTQVP